MTIGAAKHRIPDECTDSKPEFVLSCNIRDLQVVEVAPGTVAAVPLSSALTTALRAAGYAAVLAYDPVTGFRPLQRPGESPSAGAALLTQLGLDGTAPAGPDQFSDVLGRVAG